ncbi:MAG: aminotransferase class I/II-fold pyridoxal phosphate-dependent enzyme [bacterium]
MNEFFAREIERLKVEGLFREIRDRESRQGRTIRIRGREFINFASNDYLGFASDSLIMASAHKALDSFGFGSGSSRLLSGGTTAHEDLETAICRLKKTEGALILNSGYMANIGAIPALARKGGIIFSDSLNHASVIDGCRLSRAQHVVYRHGDADHLRSLLRETPAGQRMVITESVFSMDGDIAPLDALYAICEEEGAVLYIDDAHGTGVLGRGKGALSQFDLPVTDFVVQMGTFSKALGSFGAFIAADRPTIDFLINTARTVIFATALPPVVIAGALQAVALLEKDNGLIDRLWSNIRKVHRGIEALGLDKGKSSSQIIPIFCVSLDEAASLSRTLWEQGMYAPVIRPPTVKQPRIRLSVTASHTEADLDMLLDALERFVENRT